MTAQAPAPPRRLFYTSDLPASMQLDAKNHPPETPVPVVTKSPERRQ